MHIYFWIHDNPKFTDFNKKNYPYIENKDYDINNNNNTNSDTTTAATSGSKHTKDNVIFEV